MLMELRDFLSFAQILISGLLIVLVLGLLLLGGVKPPRPIRPGAATLLGVDVLVLF